MLREEVIAAASPYATHEKAVELWQEIEACGREAGRYYHTLDHFEHLLHVLTPHRTKFSDWPVVVLAIAYHDAVYNPLKSNNEEKSAALAEKRLKAIGFPEAGILRCTEFILATKAHAPGDEEINLFTDADLSVLGAHPESYQQYAKQVRLEYGMYPNFLYKRERKKVLQRFLAMNSIFKTEKFRMQVEGQARTNLRAEFQRL
jgi:predicted metal-dependent HD superfamily phosphohydrolase